MKLLRLRVDSFGLLKGEYVFDPQRVALVVDQNERGKSTLLSAVSAGLYGLDGDKRQHRVMTPLERWRPWEGGAYGLELEIESQGERYVIKRDFEKGTVEVWNARGLEVTPEFREGKDGFPVGKKLLGLDLEEFEKCAFVRQNELDAVVPGDEKVRRAGTLQARLESAADSRGGDATATEAIQLLENAIKKYTCPELDFTGMVENAIQRLEAKRGLLETEAKSLEHELAQIAKPLEELSRLGGKELDARAALAHLDEERKGSVAADLKRQLEEDDARVAELAKLKKEAEGLAASAHLPATAEAELREKVAHYEQAQRNLVALEERHKKERDKERTALDAEIKMLEPFASGTQADADRLVSLASEMRRVSEEDGKLRGEVTKLRGVLAGKGIEPERVRSLTEKFTAIDEDGMQLLRNQAQDALEFQNDLAELEKERVASSDLMRDIDAARGRVRVPASLIVAVGLGALIAGATLGALHLEGGLWIVLLAAGGAGLAVGLVMLGVAAGTRSGDRQEGLKRLSEAQRRLNVLRSKRAETETALIAMARSMRFRDPIDMMRDWNEYARVMDQSAPMRNAQEKLVALETARRAVFEDARVVLERFGGGSPDPSTLERAATAIRHLGAVRQRLVEAEKSWSWVDDEKRKAEAAAQGFKEAALRILHSAGLVYDPERSWARHVEELAERLKGRSRLKLLKDELIPAAEKRALGEGRRHELEAQLEAVEAESPGGAAKRSRPAFEIEREAKRLREELESAQKKRGDLRVQVEEVCRRYEHEHPEKLQQIDRMDRALARARRFKRSVDLATTTIQSVAKDTHKRWADFLNQRVTQILEQVGARVEELRFGDDLDFSVKLWNGQQFARGKAVAQLSAGARDQLYLAVRLALAEFLSKREDPMPLLVDDVFATSDDERARAGMRLMIEHFGEKHQVILVTCHRHRFESLAKLDPELYASRVQWLDARTTSFAR